MMMLIALSGFGITIMGLVHAVLAMLRFRSDRAYVRMAWELERSWRSTVFSWLSALVAWVVVMGLAL